MMDPLSLATTSASLVNTCTQLWSYINKVQNADVTVTVLQVEINELSQVLGSISTSFGDPVMAKVALETQTGHEAHHWKNVKRSMEDCKETLASLDRLLRQVTKVCGGYLRRPKLQFKLDTKSVEVTLLKQRIAAYRQTMQLSLQLITV
jgi:FtsZ-binding cell division protein ZapB